MLEHATLSNDIPYTFGSDDWDGEGYQVSIVTKEPRSGSDSRNGAPSSLRMYLSANERPVSFRSTIRTLPNAPRPTTRSSRKWFKFTVVPNQTRQLNGPIRGVDIGVASRW